MLLDGRDSAANLGTRSPEAIVPDLEDIQLHFISLDLPLKSATFTSVQNDRSTSQIPCAANSSRLSNRSRLSSRIPQLYQQTKAYLALSAKKMLRTLRSDRYLPQYKDTSLYAPIELAGYISFSADSFSRLTSAPEPAELADGYSITLATGTPADWPVRPPRPKGS